ncbi:PAS domain S-box protein [Lusitaniella coriacea LEGE 07157]|uniref:PAS domain S-box protein n=1 Tax=Lusitaniella coriacea LEGE 07157 TaxID=945747 RepID=A0A8J7DSS3_9CYAN|nr:adenylate/guanylate cyclase domain-containing protein [Lusitaniella coriacea]MBE9114667.1 PAS domain S-box protein [Lusitaniella coriacea LEGE 07157]
MLANLFNRSIARISRKVPLRPILVIPFVVQIFGAVGLVGYLSFRNGQQAVHQVVDRLSHAIANRIDQHIQDYLDLPHLFQQIEAADIRNDNFNLDDFERLQLKFGSLIQLNDVVDYIYIGTEDGYFLGVQQLPNGETVVKIRNASTEPERVIYQLNEEGERLEPTQAKAYDPRTRPWYKAARQAKTSTWSPIYLSAHLGVLQITPAMPLYDNEGELQGVLGTNLILSEIGKFLQTLEISQSGQAFIIERSGELVASSTTEPTIIETQGQKKRLKAVNSENLLLKFTAEHLSERFATLNTIQQTQQFSFRRNRQRYIVQVSPFRDGRGLDWLIVVTIPEDDFMAQINRNTRTTILLCIAALGIATLVGIQTARWVAKPLQQLNAAAKQLAKGQWDATAIALDRDRVDEVGQLSRSFTWMAEQLRDSFASLETKNSEMQALNAALSASEAQLRQFLNAIPTGVAIIDRDGKPYYINQTGQELLGQGIVEVNPPKSWRAIYHAHLAESEDLYPYDRDPVAKALAGVSARIDDMEIRRDNQILPLEVLGTPIYDEEGNIAYAIAVFQDITERKHAEAERQQLIEDLFEANCNLELALDEQVQLTEATRRFVPNQFLQLLNKQSIVEVELGESVERFMSVLFTDIRGFTTLSEQMNLEDNFQFINGFLSRMEPAILENNGFIDKYIGDAIMALFSHSPDDALKAGIAMLKKLETYNHTRVEAKRPLIKIGIGINTGNLRLGIVGGQFRMDSTAISDSVNLSSRLEGLTKTYGIPLLISHYTFAQLNNPMDFALRLIDRVQVKGKVRKVAVFEVFDADPPELHDAKLKTKTIFEDGLLSYYRGAIEIARQRFNECLQIFPDDTVAQIYLKRCDEFHTKV